MMSKENLKRLLIKNEIMIILALYTISALLSNFTNSYIYYYISFIGICFYKTIMYKMDNQRSLMSTIVSILIYSSILPDNYTIIFISGLILIYLVYYYKKNILTRICSNKKLIIVIIIYLSVNVFMNKVGYIKIGFFILFNFTFILYFVIFKNSYTLNIERKYIEYDIISIIFIQLVATIFNIIFNYTLIIKDFAGDWSIGTFGTNQGNMLIITMALLTILYINIYFDTRDKKKLYLAIITFSIAMTTFSLVNIIILIIILTINVIMKLHLNKNKRVLVKIFLMSISIMACFYVVSPQWVKNDIKNFTNINYLRHRVKKIDAYEETFIKIPQKDFKFMIIGNGMGNYSSRAALTTTGEYIGSYNLIFNPEISYYTKKVVVDNMYSEYAKKNQHIYASVLGTPLSSWISLMGEFGIIGILVIIYCTFKLLKEMNSSQRYLLSYFLLICIFDNWVEFAKIGLIVWISIYVLAKKEEWKYFERKK